VLNGVLGSREAGRVHSVEAVIRLVWSYGGLGRVDGVRLAWISLFTRIIHIKKLDKYGRYEQSRSNKDIINHRRDLPRIL